MLGCILLWMATDIGRNKESKIKFMRVNWWLIVLMLSTGVCLISSADYWTN